MINIVSIRCGLAFAPYLVNSLQSYLEGKPTIPQVVRQAASGLIIRFAEGVHLRYQGHEIFLNPEDVPHYFETIRLRLKVFDVVRTSDEVILSNIGDQLVISHPQSELWIATSLTTILAGAFHNPNEVNQSELPAWLTVSGGDGRLLLSDQRNGRWVLLGSDHHAELMRRQNRLSAAKKNDQAGKPPTILLKGITLHLQSAFTLVETLESFAETGAFRSFEEMTPNYCLRVARSSEGMQIGDSNMRTVISMKEARKWVAIIRDELERRNVKRLERGSIRTIIADSEQGRWVLQWGDEIFFPANQLCYLEKENSSEGNENLIYQQESSFHLILDQSTGACVALTKDEFRILQS